MPAGSKKAVHVWRIAYVVFGGLQFSTLLSSGVTTGQGSAGCFASEKPGRNLLRILLEALMRLLSLSKFFVEAGQRQNGVRGKTKNY